MNKKQRKEYNKDVYQKRVLAKKRIEKYLSTHKVNKSKCLVLFNQMTNRINKLKKGENIAIQIPKGSYVSKVANINKKTGKVSFNVRIVLNSKSIKLK
jgi:hypothetical protein